MLLELQLFLGETFKKTSAVELGSYLPLMQLKEVKLKIMMLMK